MMQISEIRPSPIAGTWYTGNAERLTKEIDAYLSSADLAEIPGKVFGLVAPHAGHRYSGATAGYAYKAVQGNQYDLVIIFSPSHGFYPVDIVTSAHRYYATPLGKVPINQETLGQFELGLQKNRVKITRVGDDEEHSIEIQLPFLQRALKSEFSLLPIMMRSQGADTVRDVAQSILPLLKSYTALLIASSDLSHFYPLDIANTLDQHMLQMVEKCSPEGVLDAERDGSGSACGSGPIAVALTLARQAKADQVKVVHYSTSADVTGDASSVVGYGAAVIYFSKAK